MAWRALTSVISSWAVFWVALVWLVFSAAAYLWSGSWWLDARYLNVDNTKAGEPVIIDLARTVRREFVADWIVTVRRVDRGSVIECLASGTASYRPGMTLPNPVTLKWLTQDRCDTLEPGRYTLDIVWAIRTILGQKIVSIESNVFEVLS